MINKALILIGLIVIALLATTLTTSGAPSTGVIIGTDSEGFEFVQIGGVKLSAKPGEPNLYVSPASGLEEIRLVIAPGVNGEGLLGPAWLYVKATEGRTLDTETDTWLVLGVDEDGQSYSGGKGLFMLGFQDADYQDNALDFIICGNPCSGFHQEVLRLSRDETEPSYTHKLEINGGQSNGTNRFIVNDKWGNVLLEVDPVKRTVTHP